MAGDERTMMLVDKGRSLSDVAFEKMSALIANGTWSARSRLPSEAELCRTFGVSRPIVRQALARLREANLILSRQGSGSFVLADGPEVEPATQPAYFAPIGSVADLETFLLFREGIEGESAATAAIRRTDEQLAKLKQVVGRLPGSRTVERLAGEDFAFHHAVAEATGNPFYANTLNSVRDQLMIGMNMAWTFSVGQGGVVAEVAGQHAAIVDAIELRQEDAARVAMRQHLRWTRARFMRGGDAEF